MPERLSRTSVKVLQDFCAEEITDANHAKWQEHVAVFLEGIIGSDAALQFRNYIYTTWDEDVERQLAYLKSLIAKNSDSDNGQEPPSGASDRPLVYVVHGHDNEAKQSVARFIEKCRLTAIIFHEQPDQGRTIVAKFEQLSDVDFAVVLLTPDDIGASRKTPDDLRPRARQNVIFELGHFIGKLGREKVCVLYREEIEHPSNYDGVLFINLDDGDWTRRLAREFESAGFDIGDDWYK